MGHVIPGSRENYFDRKDLELIRKEYLRCNFSREVPQSETTKLQKAMDRLRLEKLQLEDKLETQKTAVEDLKRKQEVMGSQLKEVVEVLDGLKTLKQELVKLRDKRG